MSNKSNHLSNLNVLQAPDFPQAENGIIDVSLLDGVILIEIHAYTAINVGDKIEVIFNEYISKDYYITDIDEYIIYIKYPDKYLPNGSYSVYYTATDNAGNINRSTATQIKIINSIVQQLPAPAFPSAVNDVLYYNSFAYDQGTIIRAAYPGITAGDKIIFFWKGTNEEGYTVGQATYRSHLIKVSIDNAADGYIQDIIPSKNIKLLGDNAICTGYYNLIRNNGGTQIISENKEVSTSWSDITQLQLVATTGAPVRDLKNYPHLTPYNTGCIFGRPGSTVILNCSPSATIGSVDSQPDTNTKTLKLDEHGLSYFQIACKSDAGSSSIPVQLFGYPQDHPDNSVNTYVEFSPYKVGQSPIPAYASSTHAPADGITPCTFYAFLDASSASAVTLTVSGNATIEHMGNTTSIQPNIDGSFTVNVFNNTPESITLYIEYDSHRILEIPMQFIDFPA